MEVEDRFGHWRSEQVGDLIWGLGAMAAEHVFYGQTTTGVGGDIGMVTWRAATMVGRHAMGPAPIDLVRPHRRQDRTRRGREAGLERFEKIGMQLMHRSDLDDFEAARTPPSASSITQLLGQAFVVAWCTIRINRTPPTTSPIA